MVRAKQKVSPWRRRRRPARKAASFGSTQNASDASIRGAVTSRLLNEGQEDGSGDLNIDGSGNAGRQVGQNR